MRSKKDIGKALQAARKSKGLTQQELADKIGKNISSVRKYENGLVNIPMDTLFLISDILDIDIKELHTGFISIAEIEKLPEQEQEKYLNETIELVMTDPLTAKVIKTVELLNNEGKEKVISYSKDLLYSGKYTI